MPDPHFVICVVDSAGNLVKAGDLANDAIRVNIVAGAAGGGAVTQGTVPWVVSSKTDLVPAAPTTATVGIASAQAVPANASRRGLHLRNTSASGQRISLSMNGAAVLDSGLTLYPQDAFDMGEYDFDVGAVAAIASAASARLSVQEFS